MMNRKLKFNLLPTEFQNTLEEDTDADWRVMIYPKFVNAKLRMNASVPS